MPLYSFEDFLVLPTTNGHVIYNVFFNLACKRGFLSHIRGTPYNVQSPKSQNMLALYETRPDIKAIVDSEPPALPTPWPNGVRPIKGLGEPAMGWDCKVCGKILVNKGNMKRHLRREHQMKRCQEHPTAGFQFRDDFMNPCLL
jgi:hypothetical protein